MTDVDFVGFGFSRYLSWLELLLERFSLKTQNLKAVSEQFCVTSGNKLSHCKIIQFDHFICSTDC